MKVFFHQLRKYHQNGVATSLAVLILVLVILGLWFSRNHALPDSFYRAALIVFVLVGLSISYCEQATIEAPTTWTFPGHLEKARMFTAGVFLLVGLMVIGIYAARREPLTALQTLAAGGIAMLAVSLGLTPRLFPAQASVMVPMAPMLVILSATVGHHFSLAVIEDAILQNPGLCILLCASIAVFGWRRLGDRNLVQQALNLNRINLVDLYNPEKQQEYRDRVRAAKDNRTSKNPAAQWESRFLKWLNQRICKPAGSRTSKLMHGSMVGACEPQTLSFAFVIPTMAVAFIGMSFYHSIQEGGLIASSLSSLPFLITLPPTIAILAGFVVAGNELCFQHLAALALPFSRRDLFRARWFFVGLLFGFSLAAVGFFYATETAIHALMPGYGRARWTPTGWLGCIKTLTVAFLPPTMAGLGFIGRGQTGRLFSLYVSVLFLGFITGTILSLFSMASPWWARGCAAGLWVIIVPLMKKRTMTEDALV